MSSAKLLIEIGVEELPAVPLLKILDKIDKSWADILKSNRLDSDYKFDYTPRRLTIRSESFPLKQSDEVVEMFGPPLNIAYKDDKPTGAALGFAKKCGVDLEQISTSTKGKNEVLYYKKESLGVDSKELIEPMVKEWLASMAFGKMMRWGSLSEEFIRPIRWIVATLDDKVVDIDLFKVKSGNTTRVHRMVTNEPKEVSFATYEDILNSGSVLLDSKARESRVIDGIKEIEAKNGVEVELDSELLREVVAITENPAPLLGTFDEKFLELPPEVIITSMKEHQRYFAVFKDGKLTNNFVVVSNAVTNDFSKIVAGNEKVLRPRLEDALFFYKNDLKRGLSTDGLEKVQFIDGLGTLMDKIDREAKIAEVLSTLYSDKIKSKDLILKAVKLAKADLMSEMVYEFTELQGLMGYYYAKALGEDKVVANAIKEQYMPTGDNAELPSSVDSALVALSIKLDTLVGLFSVGKIPTGSKDPFALRRAVNGIIRVVREFNLDFDLDTIFNSIEGNYKEFDYNTLKEFIYERIYKIAKTNPSIVKAVLNSGDTNLNSIFKKIDALDEILKNQDTKELFTTFKRVANISKDIDLESDLKVDESRFTELQESELYNAFKEIKSKDYPSYKDKLQALFGLKEKLDNYFDNVLVNSEDKSLKANRQNTIGQVYKEFKDIADIKEITA